jgi:hypothetical protein
MFSRMGDQADDRQLTVGLLLVFREAGHGSGDLPPRFLRSVPWSCSAVTAILRPAISIWTLSGWAARL